MKIKAFLIILTLATPAFAGQPGMDVVKKFKQAGLEADAPRKLKKNEYGLVPVICPGTRFFLTETLGEGDGGRIFVCEKESDAKKIQAIYEDMGKQSGFLFSWAFRNKNIVVQINGQLDDDIAEEYEAALMK